MGVSTLRHRSTCVWLVGSRTIALDGLECWFDKVPVPIAVGLPLLIADDSRAWDENWLLRSGLAWKGVGDQDGCKDGLFEGLGKLGRRGFWADAVVGIAARETRAETLKGMHRLPLRRRFRDAFARDERLALAGLVDLRAVIGCFLRDGNVMWMVLPNRRRRYLDESS